MVYNLEMIGWEVKKVIVEWWLVGGMSVRLVRRGWMWGGSGFG